MPSAASRDSTTPRRDLLPLVLLPLLLLLGGWRLDRYPRTWFDEGWYLLVGKTFVRDGLYAVQSADGLRDYTPIVAVGPPVLLPVAALLRLGGMTLLNARLVALAAFVVGSLLLYLIARGLFGRLAACCALALLLVMPGGEWLYNGRQVLGEVPAMALLLSGWLVAYRASSWGGVLLAGLLLGLAIVTKGQLLLILPVALVLTAALDWWDTRQRSLAWHTGLLTTTLATYGGWLVALAFILGLDRFGRQYELMQEESVGAFLVFNAERTGAALRLLLGPRCLCLVLPATIFGLWAIRQATGARRHALTALWLFQSCWLGWYALASLAWPRYAFFGLVVNAIFMGALAAKLLTSLRHAARTRDWRAPATLAGAALALALIALVAQGAWRTLVPIVRDGDDIAPRFAAQVEQIVPPGAVIDTWEMEIAFAIDRPFQHPAPVILNRAVRATWLHEGALPRAPEDVPLRGDYLIVGTFARWVGLYQPALDSGSYTLVTTLGDYQLYRRTAAQP